MIAAARNLMRRKLSPEAFRSFRFRWWRCRSYFTGLAAPFRNERKPKVEAFPAGETSQPANEVRDVELFVPTMMCRVMTRHGSDKGSVHNYTTVYSTLLGKLRNQPLRIFELGLGTNNPQFAFSMGLSGKPGASLRGWRELFPNALVYGADIDRDILFEEERIKTFYCDQLDAHAISDLWLQPLLRDGMDIIIDDGLHTFEANVSFLEGSLQHLRPRGVYVVEDIHKEALGKWRDLLHSGYPDRFPRHDFVLAELPHAYNHNDNNLLIIRRRE